MRGEPAYTEARAAFDDDRIYRYLLTRVWGPGPRVLWVMLNPSTADEDMLDPTLRRCLDFTMRWGFDGFEVCNLYGLRATDPRELWKHPDPIGPFNDSTIYAAARRAAKVVVGWGANARPLRELVVATILRDAGVRPLCLGVTRTRSGSPRHPLYLRADSPLIPWGAA